VQLVERPSPVHVLVAAGNAANRRIIEHILRRGQYVVQPVDTIDLVSETLAENAIDVVLLDVAGAGFDQYQAVAGWRRVRPDLSVIALVSAGNPEVERRCRDAGIDTILSKPVEPSQLLGAIEMGRRLRKTATSLDGGRRASLPTWRRALRAATAR
jgi:CheY-like chemotaxis protein